MLMNDDIPEDFHPYVRLLITHMRSHPENFHPNVHDPNTREYMTEAERMFLWDEERKIVLDFKHQELMGMIIAAGEPKPDPMSIPVPPYQTYNAYAAHDPRNAITATETYAKIKKALGI
jgi:hypothetical protein